MVRLLAAFIAVSCLAVSPVRAQGGVFEDMRAGDAVLITSAASAGLAISSVRLDAVCEGDIGTGLALQLEDALAANGISVRSDAPVVLRFESAPCETDFSRRENLAQRDVMQGTSRAPELLPPARPFEYKFGRRDSNGTRMTLNILIFKPGQSPQWNAIVAARAPGPDLPDYFAQMASFAINNIGNAGRIPFELVPVARQTP